MYKFINTPQKNYSKDEPAQKSRLNLLQRKKSEKFHENSFKQKTKHTAPDENSYTSNEPYPTADNPLLQKAIDEYLEDKKQSQMEIYHDDIEIIMDGEKNTINDALRRGWLSDWQPGLNIIECIIEKIKKSITNADGSIKIGNKIDPKSFTTQIFKELQKAINKEPGYFLVSMNDHQTVSTAKTNTNKINIFSFGQGGCTNVVIAGKNHDGELLISAFHYSPIDTNSLVNAILKEKEKYQNCTETRSVVFIMPDANKTQTDIISTSLKMLPNSSIQMANTDLDGTKKDNLLIVAADKKMQKVQISMKGQNFEWEM